MSHVDEGALHAYLDGELPPSERATLETHLTQCAECRAALDEERALRERASAVLATALPRERPMPAFEQVRRAPATKRSPWRVRRAFAWAASIALALGIGYELRSPNQQVVMAPPAPTPVTAANQIASAGTAHRDADKSVAQPRAPQSRFRAAPPHAAERTDAAAKTKAQAPRGDTGATLAGSASRDSVFRERLKAGPQLEAVVVTAQGRASTITPGERRTAAWPVITRDLAKSVLGTDPIGIPGLATRAIRRDPTGVLIVVEQALDSTNVIQFFQTPAAGNALGEAPNTPAPSPSAGVANAPNAPGRAPALRMQDRTDRLARFIGRLRVEISGPVSLDSLNRLLEQAKPLP